MLTEEGWPVVGQGQNTQTPTNTGRPVARRFTKFCSAALRKTAVPGTVVKLPGPSIRKNNKGGAERQKKKQPRPVANIIEGRKR